MAKTKNDIQNIAEDIVDACCDAIDRNTAVKGVRNICRYFGGGMFYIPVRKKDGLLFMEMYEVLRETVGDRAASVIRGKMMALFGGFQLYIPFERTAFEEVIAEEIYRRNTYENASMREIFRDYGITSNKAYQLWREGRKIKLSKETKK